MRFPNFDARSTVGNSEPRAGFVHQPMPIGSHLLDATAGFSQCHHALLLTIAARPFATNSPIFSPEAPRTAQQVYQPVCAFPAGQKGRVCRGSRVMRRALPTVSPPCMLEVVKVHAGAALYLGGGCVPMESGSIGPVTPNTLVTPRIIGRARPMRARVCLGVVVSGFPFSFCGPLIQ